MIKHLPLTTSLLLVSAGSMQAQIHLDGTFTDWSHTTSTYQEAAEELQAPPFPALPLPTTKSTFISI